MRDMRNVKIVDTTLRDGEQTAGVIFSNEQKLKIAKLLDKIGVHQIEAGIPIIGGDEKEAIKNIVKADLNASIMAWNRAEVDDIKASLDCGVDSVAISISTSDVHIKQKLKKDRNWVIRKMTETVNFAKKNDLYVCVSAEDASRSDRDFLIRFAKEAKAYGADRIRFCDTVGIMDPFNTKAAIEDLILAVDIDVEMHTHNGFGLGVANALAGAKGGAKYIGLSVNGLGERAGNPALEEVLMALKYLYDVKLDFEKDDFRELSEYVSKASSRDLPPEKAIFGTHIFAHESGIHKGENLKDISNYEVFSPEEIGTERQISIDENSTKNEIVNKFKEYGIKLNDSEADNVTKQAKKLSKKYRRALFDKELMYIYDS
jgi:homocitrate synthase NifV